MIDNEPPGWYIVRIPQPTTATNFRGEITHFDHYYRLYSVESRPIRYGKFQQLDRLAAALHCDPADLPLIGDPRPEGEIS